MKPTPRRSATKSGSRGSSDDKMWDEEADLVVDIVFQVLSGAEDSTTLYEDNTESLCSEAYKYLGVNLDSTLRSAKAGEHGNLSIM